MVASCPEAIAFFAELDREYENRNKLNNEEKERVEGIINKNTSYIEQEIEVLKEEAPYTKRDEDELLEKAISDIDLDLTINGIELGKIKRNKIEKILDTIDDLNLDDPFELAVYNDMISELDKI